LTELTYDAEADALYLCLVDGGHSSSDVKTYSNDDNPGILVDTWDGNLHGIEVLAASKHPIFRNLLPTIAGGTLKSFEARL
jgi:uncharacterized protein YuzE